MDLASKQCIPCKGGVAPLKGTELTKLQEVLGNGWEVVDEHHLTKEFRFKNFRDALRYVNLIGETAEEQKHHPDMRLAWGRVGIDVWTHKIDGLTESDFVFAAKAEQLFKSV